MNSQRVRGATDLDTYFGASVTFSATASPTDIWRIQGSATRLVRVQRVVFSGVQGTAGNVGTIALKFHSVANTGGTSASITAVPADSSSRPASASLVNYTANPTIDSSALILWQPRMNISATGTTDTSGVILDMDFTQYLNCRGLVLRGVAQELAINMGGVLPGSFASAQVSCIWTEE